MMMTKTLTLSNIQYLLNDFLSQSGTRVDKQIAELTQRRVKLVPKLEEILCRMRSPHYLTKVPAHIRQQMDSKVSAGQ